MKFMAAGATVLSGLAFDPSPGADFETLVWTAAAKPASAQTASLAVLKGARIDGAEFDPPAALVA